MKYIATSFGYFSLAISFIFAIIQGFFYVAKLKPEILLKGFLVNINESKFFSIVVIGCLMISRTLLSLPEKAFKRFSIASAIFFVTFLHYRMIMVMGFDKTGYFWLVSSVFMFVVGTINGILRISIKVGATIDDIGIKSELVKSIIFEMTEKVFKSTFRATRQMWPSSNPDIPKARSFGRLAIYAAVVSVPIAGVVAWDNHLSRLANQASAKAAEVSAKAAEMSAKAAEVSAKAVQQRTDIKAVKHGLMSIEQYNNKYPEN